MQEPAPQPKRGRIKFHSIRIKLTLAIIFLLIPVVSLGTADVDATRLLWHFFQEHPLGK